MFWRAFLVLLCAAAASAQAQEPAVQQQGGIRFVAGGVGIEERTALAAQRPQYNLHLVFGAKHTGHYVANVKVEIRDAKGNTVLETRANGPMLFAQLAPGSYSVLATYGNSGQGHKFTISGKGAVDLAFHWADPASTESRDWKRAPAKAGAKAR